MHCGSPPVIHSSNLLVTSSIPACTHLTRTPGESKLHHRCILPSLPLPPFIGKAAFMDDGSRGRRMVRKELDVTSTHELLSHTLLAGCDRSSIAQTLGIWKSRLHHRGADFEYGNATGRGATPSFAMQHPLAAGSPSTSSHTGWKANRDGDFSTSFENSHTSTIICNTEGPPPPAGLALKLVLIPMVALLIPLHQRLWFCFCST